MFSNFPKYFAAKLFLLSFFIFIGCTRPEGETVKISFSLPAKSLSKNSSQGVSALSSVLNYVAVNVTGANMQPLFCSWDLDQKTKNGSCQFSLAATGNVNIELDVPPGSARLFQVIEAFNESTGGAMTFQYGDSQTDLSSGNQTVSLQLASIGGADVSGHIKGRFFKDGTTGPTGTMKIMLRPNPTRPAMMVMQSEIYAGWFQTFAFENTKFEYIVDGVSLFGGPVSKADLLARASSSLQVSPATNGTEFTVWGYFGDATGVSGKQALVSGCAGGTEFSNCLQKDFEFVGPFKQNPASGQVLSVITGPPSKIAWQFLPGIDATTIDGVTVMQSTLSLTAAQLDSVVIERGFNCEAYRSFPGVNVLGTVAISASAQELVTTSVHTPDPLKPLVVCPQKGSSLLTAAIVSPKLQQDGGCPDCKYLRVELSPPAMPKGDSYRVPPGECVPMNFSLYKGQGISESAASAVNFQFTTPAWAEVHQSPGCGDAALTNPNVSIAAGAHSQTGTYYIKATAGASVANAFTLGAITGDIIQFSPDHNMVDIELPTLGMDVPNELLLDACYPLKVSRFFGSNPYSPTTMVSVALTSTNGIEFFSNPADCAAGTSAQSPNYSSYWITGATTFGTTIYFRRHSGSNSTLSASTAGYTGVTKAFVDGTGVLQVAKYVFSVGASLNVGACVPVTVIAKNINDTEIPVPSNVTLNLSANPQGKGFFYNDGNCGSALLGPAGPQLTLNTGQSRATFFYRASTVTASMSFLASSGDGLSAAGPSSVVSIVAPSTGNWASLQVPQIARTILPSENFPIAMPVTGNMAGLKCYRYTSSVNWSDDGLCNGQFNATTQVFNWDASIAKSDLSSSTKYYFGTQMDWNSQRGAYFDPANFYGAGLDMPPGSSYETGMSVSICSVVLTADGVKTFDDVQAALNANAVVCLKKGVSDTFNSTGSVQKLILAPGKSLIGVLDPVAGYTSAVKLQGSSAYSVIEASSATASDVTSVANLTISTVASASNIAGLDVLSTAGKTLSYGNTYKISSGSSQTSGIKSAGSSVVSVNDTFQILTVGADFAIGFKMEDMASATSKLYYPVFNLTSAVSQPSVGVHVANSGTQSTSITTKIWGGSFFGQGVAIEAATSNAGMGAAAECYQCSLKMSASSYSGSVFGPTGWIPNIFQYSYGNVKIQDSVIVNAEDSPVFGYQGTQDKLYTFSSLENSVINQNANAPVFQIQGAYSPSISIHNNHFVATSGLPYVIGGTTTTDATVLVQVQGASAPTTGGNVFCGPDGSNNWHAGFVQQAVDSAPPSQFVVPAASLNSVTDFGGFKICNGLN